MVGKPEAGTGVEEPVMRVEGLTTRYPTRDSWLDACQDVGLVLLPRQTLGVVGESGSGKSSIGLSIMRLVPRPGRIVKGHVWLDGVDLLAVTEREMRRVRGRRVAMVFQDAMNTLDPCYRVGSQLTEAIRLHERASRRAARGRAEQLLRSVHLDPRTMRVYPHELSGGMRQRVGIALALAGRPSIIIADEPTTALDVTVQAEIQDLLREVCIESGMSLMLISHDLAVVARMAERVIVMYGGRVVESGSVSSVLELPAHPYTASLLASVPPVDRRVERLLPVPGDAFTSRLGAKTSCVFVGRCPYATARCTEVAPALGSVGVGHLVACHYPLQSVREPS